MATKFECEPLTKQKDRDMVHDKVETERQKRSKDANRAALGWHVADQLRKAVICEYIPVEFV
jgi:hypothetical protein